MSTNKDERISFRCTKDEKNFITSEAKRLNMTIYNYIINSSKGHEINKNWSKSDVREVAEIGNYIKSLEYKYKIELDDSNELKRRILKLCQN